jgi:peptidoglycan/LPS O-acetylase OafA/YrhL
LACSLLAFSVTYRPNPELFHITLKTDEVHSGANPILNLKYYPAIDGLRAFAVLAVIINHFNENLLPSGYLGVDIFFVISGFVITSSLAGREDQTVRSFLGGFYSRRIKRLMPALTLCVISTSVLICLFNPTPGVHLRTGLASLFGFSNIDLYLNAVDYWGDSAQLNPFTHTWSLGVEEQFYLIFPIMMWLTVLGRRSDQGHSGLAWLLAATGLLSITAFVFYMVIDQPATYFLMPFRFWELAAGCLLFLFLQRTEKVAERTLSKLHPIALILAIIAVLFLPKDLIIPATISVVFLTTLLIARLHTRDAGHALLSNKVVVYLGLISYSLYLWHWSVITISRWTIGIHWWTWPFQVALILILSIASYHLVERPLRHANWLSSTGRKLRTGLALTLSIVLLTFLSISSDQSLIYLGGKKRDNKLNLSELENRVQCGKSNQQSGRKKIIRSIGNSHSRHIVPMLEVIARTCGLEIISLTRDNQIVTPSGKGLDKETLEEVFRPLIDDDILILSSRNRFVYSVPYLNGNGNKWIDHSDEREGGIGLDSWLLELDTIIDQAYIRGINIVLFLPNVEFDEQVLHYPSMCNGEWFQLPKRGCNPSVSKDFLDKRFPEYFYSQVNKRSKIHSHFYIFDPLAIYCKDSKKCSRIVDGIVAFHDTNHLSATGSLLMLQEFDAFLIENGLL